MKVGIVNNGLGNVGSVYSALKFYKKYDAGVVNDVKELESADVIILAGVGNFVAAVSRLKKLQFWDKLNEEVLVKKKPVLGICLGMQLFADVSYEDGENKGFGWISGKVIKIDESLVRIPHIGWNEVKYSDDTLFKGMLYNFFYFMHSYHFVPDDKNVIIGKTDYNNFEIVSAVKKENIVGVQFHPEKSQGDGLRFLRNFLEVFFDI